jgi:N6-adenosine-specific RNA methylase IME4
MANHPYLDPSVLFAADDDSVFVIDIPHSIAIAQGTEERPWDKVLVSKVPPEEPLKSLEPKSDLAREHMREHGQTNGTWEKVYVDAVLNALLLVKESYHGPFCLPRATIPRAEPTRRKRLVTEALSDSISDTSNIVNSPSPITLQSLIHNPSSYVFTTSSSDSPTPWSSIHCNTQSEANTLHVHRRDGLLSPSALTFHLPPHATFLLATLPPPTPSHTPAITTGFNLVVLDPPWPNRSAKRATHYRTPQSVPAVRSILDGLHLSAHLSATGPVFVALWITNSQRVREAVYGPEGWLADLGCDVVEEWVWMKVTTQGDAISSVHGTWRKPFEVLVIARLQEHATGEAFPPKPTPVRRRVILAVPDLHSRKPCLKGLFKRLLDLPEKYVALEVFARNLVAGWHAWGNETLKFNSGEHWRDRHNLSGQWRADHDSSEIII